MTLKELKDLLKILRAQGVTNYVTAELSLTLTESLPQKEASPQHIEEQPELTPEQLLYYSAGLDVSQNNEEN